KFRGHRLQSPSCAYPSPDSSTCPFLTSNVRRSFRSRRCFTRLRSARSAPNTYDPGSLTRQGRLRQRLTQSFPSLWSRNHLFQLPSVRRRRRILRRTSLVPVSSASLSVHHTHLLDLAQNYHEREGFKLARIPPGPVIKMLD
uniref:Uncharacterized protein n=1 Tax=Triticum urartu TaxID=4572 RepID=A0A8R7PGW1_TRIUA